MLAAQENHQKAEVNATEDSKWTPLHLAVYKNHPNIASLLISKGAEVNAREGSNWTSLHRAAYKNWPNIASFLISKGAEVNARSPMIGRLYTWPPERNTKIPRRF